MEEGIILKGVGSFYTVYSFNDNKEYVLRAKGIFRKDELIPTVGDRVYFSLKEKQEGLIEEILPRKNILIRPSVSNVDKMVIVASIKKPNVNFLLLDKMLINAKKQNLEVLICFNKIDLASNEEIDKIKIDYGNCGCKLYFVSVKEEIGIKELKNDLLGKVIAFSGVSGAGKSSLFNKISPLLNLETGDISRKIDRGKHTTRHVELILWEKNSFLADTPGFSSLEIFDVSSFDLWQYYREFYDYSDCYFSSCMHINEPKCNVIKAVKENKISALRYENYKKLLEEVKKREARNK